MGPARVWHGTHQIGMQDDGTAPDTVFALHGFKTDNALAHRNASFDDPIKRSAVENFFSPFGPVAGDMDQAFAPRQTRSLIALQLINLINTDT